MIGSGIALRTHGVATTTVSCASATPTGSARRNRLCLKVVPPQQPTVSCSTSHAARATPWCCAKETSCTLCFPFMFLCMQPIHCAMRCAVLLDCAWGCLCLCAVTRLKCFCLRAPLAGRAGVFAGCRFSAGSNDVGQLGISPEDQARNARRQTPVNPCKVGCSIGWLVGWLVVVMVVHFALV